jgi:hypothetical protein
VPLEFAKPALGVPNADPQEDPNPIPRNCLRLEILAGGSANFGQIVQPGSLRQLGEFSYIVAGVTLIMPTSAFRWPEVMMITAPTPMKTEFPTQVRFLRLTRSRRRCWLLTSRARSLGHAAPVGGRAVQGVSLRAGRRGGRIMAGP